MRHVPVSTCIPEVPRWLGDDLTPDQWAFRCLMFYAAPVPTHPTGPECTWLIRVAQVHIKRGDWRFLYICPIAAQGGNVTGIEIGALPPTQTEFVAEMKFWTTPFYECDVNSNKAERVEYTHQELLRHLCDPRTQKNLLKNVSSNFLPFWGNLVQLLVHLRIIAPESTQTYYNTIRTTRNT
ncbi:hypothetical protein RSOL_419520, partial [Rhizoctonia solani AG-3 Rhs1AP]